MLPLREIACGLLHVQHVSRCILPRLLPATSALWSDPARIQGFTSPLGHRGHSSSAGSPTGGEAQASAKDPSSVMVGCRPTMSWGWAAYRPLQQVGNQFSNHLHRRAATAAGGGGAAAAAASGAAPPMPSNIASQQQQQRTASNLMQLQTHVDDNDTDDAEEDVAYRVDPAHPSFSQQQQQQAQPVPPGTVRRAGPHVVRDLPDPYTWQQAPGLYQQQQQVQQQQQPTEQRLAVKAYYLGGEVNLQRLLEEHSLGAAIKYQGRDSIIVELQDSEDTLLLGGPGAAAQLPQAARFVAVFRFGAVIFFGSAPEGQRDWLERLRGYVTLDEDERAGRKAGDAHVEMTDETTVVVRTSLPTWCGLEPDSLVVQSLDVGNTKVIGQVLGQSVALDHYNRKVDQAIQAFKPYLFEIADQGESRSLNDSKLLQLIGENSLLYTDVVTKLGLLDTSDTAWRNDKYYEVWQVMRKDYELERRFDALNRKLGPMLENAKFILDVRVDRKTATSEKTIIWLIAIEIMLHLGTHMLGG